MVKVTVKNNIIKICLSNILSELLVLLQLKLVRLHIIIRWIVLWKDWIALLWSWSRSRKRLRIPVTVHLNVISSVAEPSVTKLAIVVQHHGPKCHARRLVCCLQVSPDVTASDWLGSKHPLTVFRFTVTVRAHLIKYDYFYHICWTADLFATKFNWMLHHHKLECFVQKMISLFSRSRSR